MNSEKIASYLIQCGDNALILGQRLAEWCGHGPVLEQDMALTNIALDLIGQARYFYQAAGEIVGKTEDDLVYFRDTREYQNVLLVEQPNQDFAFTIIRQFLYDVYDCLHLEGLVDSSNIKLSAIGTKAFKEAKYHLRFSCDWVKRLGDGTAESNQRLQNALNTLWRYHDELYSPTHLEERLIEWQIIPDLNHLKKQAYKKIHEVISIANLQLPKHVYMQTGGKTGMHTEYLGHILAELQFVQRAYPGLNW